MKNILKTLLLRIKSILESTNSIDRTVSYDSSTSIHGCTISKGAVLKPKCKLNKSALNGKILVGFQCEIMESELKGEISLGANVKLHKCYLNGNIKIGNFSTLWGPNLDFFTHKYKIETGNFCSIARNVSIQAYNHNSKKITTYFIGKNLFKENWSNEISSNGDIIIENDVWIGSHCVILGGITISNGAVIAANSVVNKDVPPYSIVAGSPAKVIGYRFNQEIIEFLQELKWWNWEELKIVKFRSIFENEIENIDQLKNYMSQL